MMSFQSHQSTSTPAAAYRLIRSVSIATPADVVDKVPTERSALSLRGVQMLTECNWERTIRGAWCRQFRSRLAGRRPWKSYSRFPDQDWKRPDENRRMTKRPTSFVRIAIPRTAKKRGQTGAAVSAKGNPTAIAVMFRRPRSSIVGPDQRPV